MQFLVCLPKRKVNMSKRALLLRLEHGGNGVKSFCKTVQSSCRGATQWEDSGDFWLHFDGMCSLLHTQNLSLRSKLHVLPITLFNLAILCHTYRYSQKFINGLYHFNFWEILLFLFTILQFIVYSGKLIFFLSAKW